MTFTDAQPVTGNTEHTRPENRLFYPALDGIRGFAFLLVFLHHYIRLQYGWIGVDIFFVLSGFLITGILYDSRDHAHRVRNFYVRRSLRIFPLYYAILLPILVAAPFVHWQWDWRWISWPLYLGNLVLFMPGPIDAATVSLYNGWLTTSHSFVIFIGHFWSLCVEEQFYMVWPWIVFKIRDRRKLLAIAAAIVALWPFLRMLADHYVSPARLAAGITLHSTPFRLDSLMMGAVVALLFRGPARAAVFKTARTFVWIAGVITAVALAAFALHPALLHRRDFKPFLFTFGFSIIALFAATLIICCLVPGSLLTRVFSFGILRWVGRISYGAYVFHDLPHNFYALAAHRFHLPTSSVALPCTLALAWLSFRFLESPFLNLKERYTLPDNPGPLPRPATGG